MTRVLIHTDHPQRHMARLAEAFPKVHVESCTRNSKLPKLLADFKPDAMFSVNISSDAPFPREAILGCESLKWLSVAGSGTDHVAPWDERKLTVTNSAGVAADMMAEYVMGAFIHFNIDVPGLMADQRERVWKADRSVRPLMGSTVLIVGLGSTGRAVAARAKAFGMTVVGTRANPQRTPHCDEVHGAEYLPQLWPRADYIVISSPRLPSTRGLVDASAFALMKSGAVLVNVARGGVVDEAALADALRSGDLRGAAMDVFATEPLPAENPIWQVPHLLISPHCSAVYEGWEDASMRRFSDNLALYLAGKDLKNRVDPARGY